MPDKKPKKPAKGAAINIDMLGIIKQTRKYQDKKCVTKLLNKRFGIGDIFLWLGHKIYRIPVLYFFITKNTNNK